MYKISLKSLDSFQCKEVTNILPHKFSHYNITYDYSDKDFRRKPQRREAEH